MPESLMPPIWVDSKQSLQQMLDDLTMQGRVAVESQDATAGKSGQVDPERTERRTHSESAAVNKVVGRWD